MQYILSNRARIVTIVLMLIGIVSLVLGYINLDGDRFWANLLINGLFFTFIGLGALFFIALQYATEAAWSQMVRRIYEALTAILPFGLAIIAIVLIAGSMHVHHIYHWMDSNVYPELIMESSIESGHFEAAEAPGPGVVENPEYDKIISDKQAFLNLPFFWLRYVVYAGVFLFFAWYFRRTSLKEDEVGGTEIHKTNYRRGALFLVFFAVFSSTLAWDWIMSIDTHWFSTMYGWYAFSGMWCTAMTSALILVLYLKSKGLLPMVNDSHIHDMGKWMFATSFLWTYLWFSQFMLIWYSNIPEEVTYFYTRFEHYGIPMFGMLLVNFILPMVILMARDAKRNVRFLITVGTIIFFGHWFDVYLMVIPGVVFDHWYGMAIYEVGMLLGFLGAFMHFVLNALKKAKLVPENSPYMEESIQHHI